MDRVRRVARNRLQFGARRVMVDRCASRFAAFLVGFGDDQSTRPGGAIPITFDHRRRLMRLRGFLEQTEPIQDHKDLFQALRGFLADYGANLVSYHIVIENLLRVRVDDGFHYHCFPSAWVDHYLRKNYFAIDPIISAAMTAQAPFRWYDVGKVTALSPEQNAYLDDMRSWGLVDGLAVPIFAAHGTTAYFGVGSDAAALTLTSTDELEIQYACNHAHRMFVDLRAAQAKPQSALSNREREVLTWVARGKSNSVIADILGVSDHTVDTLVRRVFAKLAVSDRISAAIKGIGAGLVSL
jgi:DNA-binding CsgD family transcriptional regulator